MTLTNQERALRCQQAIAAYSDDDAYTNLVDFIADAIHFSHQNGYSFTDALDTAVMHFAAEVNGDDILDDLNRQATNKRNHTMTDPKPAQNDAHKNQLRSVTEAALDAFWQLIVQRYPEAETGDLSPLTTIRLDEAARVAVEEWVWANVPTSTNE
jgi:hypothetical protein